MLELFFFALVMQSRGDHFIEREKWSQHSRSTREACLGGPEVTASREGRRAGSGANLRGRHGRERWRCGRPGRGEDLERACRRRRGA
jgi:hypothetical protein